MKFTWLGHAGIRLEIAGQVLLIDPWLEGNPVFPADRRAEAIEGATAILITHGHADHITGVPEIAKDLGVPVYGGVELMGWWAKSKGVDTIGFNKGGTVQIGDVCVTMVAATHSSSLSDDEGKPIYTGAEAGYFIAGEGKTIYVSGDTDVMADMAIWNDIHAPDIGVLCAGGFYTMDMKRAAYAASKLFTFQTVIPYHYGTFPALEQSADALKTALTGVAVVVPEVMEDVYL